MATFFISNLNTVRNFNFEGIRFESLSNDIKDNDGIESKSEKQLRKKHNIIFQAVVDDTLDIKPIISNNGLIGVVDDICLLLSLPLSSYVYFYKYTINGTTTIGRVLHVSDAVGSLMVKFNKIEPFLDTAAESLRKPDWAAKTRIHDSINFLRSAFCSEFVDVAFMLSWIALEILANAYASEQGISTILPKTEFNKSVKSVFLEALNEIDKANLCEYQKELIINKLPELNNSSIRYKIYKLRDACEWDFMTNQLIDDCYKFRNSFTHDGTHAGFDQRKLYNLLSRLKDAIQLALIDLLGCSSYVPDLQGFKIKIKGD
jgi:hypothetical protein